MSILHPSARIQRATAVTRDSGIIAIVMAPSWKENVSFILVEPREPGNIGAAARALANMGFRTLEMVNPVAFHTEEAKWMACQGYRVLEEARVHANVGDAIREKHLIVGTTRRIGRRRGLIVPLREGAPKIVAAARHNRIGILFGPERTGLRNSEVDECGFLVTIPCDPDAPSLNLAQSVLLVAYELGHASYTTAFPRMVEQEKMVRLHEKIGSTLRLLEYIPRGDRDLERKVMKNLKHLLGRAGLTEWELNMLYGICSQVDRKLRV